ncbi:hypothetical protein JXA59_00650 [Patescibacteria group bacterium]|nr:hypothetical protein [Patescibacteria group bacterium]
MKSPENNSSFSQVPSPDSGGAGSNEKTREQKIAEATRELFVRAPRPEDKEPIDLPDKFVEMGEPYSEHLPHWLNKEGLTSLVKERADGQTVLDLGCGSSREVPYVAAVEWGAKHYIGVDLHRSNTPSLAVGDLTAEEIDAILSDPSGDVPVAGKNTGPKSRAYMAPTSDYATEDLSKERIAAMLEAERKPHRVASEPAESIVNKESRIISTDETETHIMGDMLDCISRLEDGSVGVIVASGLETMPFSTDSDYIRDKKREYSSRLAEEITRVLKHNGILISYESDVHPQQLAAVKYDKPTGYYSTEHYASIYQKLPQES